MSDCPGDGDGMLERIKSGDEGALAELFSRHRDRLWRIVHFRLDKRLAGRVDAEDILQEAYLDAAGRIGHFSGDSETSFFIWLRMIVNQTLIDVHRRHLGTKMRDADREVGGARYSQTTTVSMAANLLGHLTSPTLAARRAEMSTQLEKSLEGMDPIDREILALRHFEELTNREVAEVLGIQQKAASIRYVRALRRLKGVLTETPGFATDYQGGV